MNKMTEQDKQLLLKDLCARLPYGVKFEFTRDNVRIAKGIDLGVTDDGKWEYFVTSKGASAVEITEIKPYLRPLSSMTEDEKKEFEKISHCFLKTIVLKRDRKFRIVEQKAYFDNEIPSSGAFGDGGDYRFIKQEYFVNLIDWLNSHHFDYRGLIEKGLALEAPEGMYKTE